MARCSRNQPPKTAPRLGPNLAPNWPERRSRPGFSPQTYLEAIQTSSADCRQALARLQAPRLPSPSPQLPGFLTHPSRLRSLLLGGGSGGSFGGSFSRQYGGSAGRQPETDKQLNIQSREETRFRPHRLVHSDNRI